MRLKTFLALVLLLHFLAHPAVHPPALGPADSASLSTPSQSDSPVSARESLGSCLACRTASAALAAPAPLLLPADTAASEAVVWRPVSKKFLSATSLFPARAPPLA